MKLLVIPPRFSCDGVALAHGHPLGFWGIKGFTGKSISSSALVERHWDHLEPLGRSGLRAQLVTQDATWAN